MTSASSIQLLREEKSFNGTGFKTKDFIVALGECDRVSGLRLFPGLQSDHIVCGPNPRKVVDMIRQVDISNNGVREDEEDEQEEEEEDAVDERYEQELATFHLGLRPFLPEK